MDHIALVPPAARKQPVTTVQLGRSRRDDYGWLKDENWQAVLRDPGRLNPAIRDHLLAENAYTKAVLAETETLQKTLAAEMKARIRQDDASVPLRDGAYEYYRRYEPGAQHPVFARRAQGGAEEILLDADAAAKGLGYYRVAAAAHSPDHRLFAYAADSQGAEMYEIRIKNLETGALLPEVIAPSTGNFAFSPCSRFIFWTYRDKHSRPTKIFCRRVGWAEDRLVYEEPDEGFYISVEAAASGGSIFINCGNKDSAEVWRIPGAEPTAAPAVIAPREPGLLYSVEDRGDTLIILTNADGAVDFKIMQVPSAAPQRANWRDVVPHRPGHYITGLHVLRDYILHTERAEANDRIVVTRRDGSWFPIDMEEPAYALRLEPGYEYATSDIRYVYSSPTTPAQWFDYDIATGARVLRKTQEIPSGHDPALYETRRLHAPAADGAQIPVTVLMRRGTKLDGSAPVHLYGYGAYGLARPAGFSSNILSLVDRGWIHVIAHVRGGSEKGWNWFLGGRGANKINSFTDFIAVAEHLIAQGYARQKHIVAHGGSAGGLLMGAVLNLRPDLWGGVIAAVPFVDVLNTMSDTSLPMTPPEWPEWGNPITDAQAYDTIAAYSPYDNITAQDYPAVLATGGLSDPRVTYWEPAKFIAKLRDYSTGSAPLLLHINMEAGHAGAAGRFDALAETARDYAFAIWALEGK